MSVTSAAFALVNPLLLLAVARRKPNAGRAAFAAYFLSAALANALAALGGPRATQTATNALPPGYQDLVAGALDEATAFAERLGVLAFPVAAAQAAVATLLLGKGRPVTLGLAGALALLVATAPLETGAFLTHPLYALGIVLLLRHGYETTVPTLVAMRLRTPAAHGPLGPGPNAPAT